MTHKELFRYIKTKRDWKMSQSKDKSLSAKWDILEIGSIRYILFQETNGVQDWISNFAFKKRKYDNLYFHKGFYEGYDLMRDELIEYLLKHNDDKHLIVAGWSRGAALAQIATQDIFYHTGKKVELISFGSPMAIYGKHTRDVCREACITATEYCHKKDIVTYQPPFKFYHINRVNCGTAGIGIMNPNKWHTHYDEYEEVQG